MNKHKSEIISELNQMEKEMSHVVPSVELDAYGRYNKLVSQYWEVYNHLAILAVMRLGMSEDANSRADEAYENFTHVKQMVEYVIKWD